MLTTVLLIKSSISLSRLNGKNVKGFGYLRNAHFFRCDILILNYENWASNKKGRTISRQNLI